MKNVVYVSSASKWDAAVKQGSLVDENPYWRVWLRALETVGGDWQAASGCELGETKEEAEANILAKARGRWNDSPTIQRLPWGLDEGFVPPPKSTPSVPSKATEGYLTIEDNALAERQRAQRDAFLKSQQQEAATLSKRVADTARDNAKTQAKLKKFLEDLRKRGRAQ